MFDQSLQLEVFPTRLHLRRIDPAENMRRFYRLQVQRDLFGGASLVREWGRLGCRGRILVERHADEGGAITALLDLAQRKRQRGFVI